MNKENVIKGLETIKQFFGYGLPSTAEMFDLYYGILNDAIVLLKEQQAKPVIVTTNAYGTRFYHCPKCNRDLYVYPRQLYCSNCGQAVKWNA